jgi:DNA-binding CsgD family transcriptional regulator
VNISDAVDHFCTAVLNRAEWPTALEQFSHAAGAVGATLVVGTSTPASVTTSTALIETVDEYFAMRQVNDPREDRITPTLERGFVTDFDVFSVEEIARDPFYQEFLRPRGFAWHAAACLAIRPVPVFLSFKRLVRQGPFEAGEVETLQKALPYLRNTVSALAAMQGATAGAQLHSFARAGLGAMALDWRGHVLGYNKLVTLGDGISIVGGEPRATHPHDQAELDRAVRLALHARPVTVAPAPRRLLLRRRAGRRGLVADVMPVSYTGDNPLARAVVLILLTDLDHIPAPANHDLRQIFGLTPREAELAARIATGERLESIAEALSISREHARQRLKIIFEKTATHRQAELVALLSRLR